MPLGRALFFLFQRNSYETTDLPGFLSLVSRVLPERDQFWLVAVVKQIQSTHTHLFKIPALLLHCFQMGSLAHGRIQHVSVDTLGEDSILYCFNVSRSRILSYPIDLMHPVQGETINKKAGFLWLFLKQRSISKVSSREVSPALTLISSVQRCQAVVSFPSLSISNTRFSILEEFLVHSKVERKMQRLPVYLHPCSLLCAKVLPSQRDIHQYTRFIVYILCVPNLKETPSKQSHSDSARELSPMP